MSSEKAFILVIRIVSAAFIAVSILHLLIGTGADASLGVIIPPEMAIDPSVDSQNRFYGVTFSLLGVVLLIASGDLRRHQPFILAVLGVLFAAGLARVLSLILYGIPSPMIVVILVADLFLPPLLYIWLKRCLAGPAGR